MGRNPLDCLQRPDATLQTCTFSTPTGKIEADRIQRQMAAQAGIEFVNVRSWFCYRDQCPSVAGNRVVYADVGHIWVTFAQHLAPLLSNQLRLR